MTCSGFYGPQRWQRLREPIDIAASFGDEEFVGTNGQNFSNIADFLGGTTGSFGTVPDTCPEP
ncbi:MAG: hypothetical protein ACI88C_001866 [Acidimicrobiales bacterium]